MKFSRIITCAVMVVFGFVLVGAVSQCEASRIRDWEQGPMLGGPPPVPPPAVQSPKIAPDGEYILFENRGRLISTLPEGRIISVQPDGTLRQIPSGPSAPSVFVNDTLPDISHDGSRVVYSTRRYYTGGPFRWNRLYSMEIATSKPDGNDFKRLTNDEYNNMDPVWSPDGTRVAFLSRRGEPVSGEAMPPGIYTINSDGFDERLITHAGKNRGTPTELVWSPDGRYIAFSDYDHYWSDESGARQEHFIALVGADGSGFRRIVESEWDISVPSWSPDSRRIAFRIAEDDSEAITLYTFDIHEDIMREVYANPRRGIRMSQHPASWTSDGSMIVFYGFAPDPGFYVVGPDGTNFRRLPIPGGFDDLGGWTLDGSRLIIRHFPARYEHGAPVIRSVNLDGTNETVLARYAYDEIVGAKDWEDEAPDCESGIAVTDPKSNPGLIRDCEILLIIRDRLGAESPLNWQPYRDIRSWDGIRVGGSPSRVEKIEYVGTRLGGSIPAEISELTELKVIRLPSQGLSGEIPPELGNLAKLESLILIRNQLTGSIPPELGNLANLKRLYIAENQLSGSVPLELGNLKNLTGLSLAANDLSGCIPSSLANIEDIHGLVRTTGLDLC